MNPDVATPLFVVAAMVTILFLWQSIIRFHHRRRWQRALQTDDQTQLSQATPFSARLKKHLLYAPIWGNRHSREFRLFRRLHMGSPPLRVEVILLLVYIALNFTFVVVTVDWWTDFPRKMFQLKYAAGHLAVMNTPGLVLSAGRNNPLVPLLGLSFDTFNFMHRWVGRIVIANAVIHMGSVLANQAYLSTHDPKIVGKKCLTAAQMARNISGTLSGRCLFIYTASWYVSRFLGIKRERSNDAYRPFSDSSSFSFSHCRRSDMPFTNFSCIFTLPWPSWLSWLCGTILRIYYSSVSSSVH